MAKEIHTIEIGLDGGASVEVKGIKGRKCLDATREIQGLLGTTTTITNTSEMNESEPVKVSN